MARERRTRHRDLLIVAAAFAAALTGCGSPGPSPAPSLTGEQGLPAPSDFARQVVALDDGRAFWRIRPWQLDDSVGYVCVRDPSSTWIGAQPVVTDAERCLPLKPEINGPAVDMVQDELLCPKDRLPWEVADGLFLAVAGRSNGVVVAKVVDVDALTPKVYLEDSDPSGCD